MSLRVLALAAPQFPADPGKSRALDSEDPASLFNACRHAARLAAEGRGPWGDSNWAQSRTRRRDSVLLLRSLADLPRLHACLAVIRPNLVLIGSMTICLPGAVACARAIKEALGEDVCVVLGGRHATESMYTDGAGQVVHHPGSPLRLLAEGRIPADFDIVAAGDGEHFVAALGELVARTEARGLPAARARETLGELALAPGRWVAGAVDGGQIRTVRGVGPPLDYCDLWPPCALFGVRARFNVFGGRPTAHVFSDVGGGCIYDCTFCSERQLGMGPLRQLESSADRLFRQVEAAARVIAEDHAGQGASAFVEDSTFLAFAPRLVTAFVDRMRQARLDVRLGGQLTIDQVLSRPHLLGLLREVGVEYLFVGLETFSPVEVGGLSKDVRRHAGTWIERAEAAFEALHGQGICGGAALLFGLGESHDSRLALLEQVRRWRGRFGMPYPVSMNWAVQHPLLGQDGGAGYTYTDWAIPEGPFLEAFREFGEASLRYPLAGKPAPVLAEVQEVQRVASELLDPPPAHS